MRIVYLLAANPFITATGIAGELGVALRWQRGSWDTGGMFELEIYGRVRRAVRVEGKGQRAVAREFGLSRDTVRKMLHFAVLPGYQRQQPIRRPKLGPWLGLIDAILEDDKQRPVKQRHTAKRTD